MGPAQMNFFRLLSIVLLFHSAKAKSARNMLLLRIKFLVHFYFSESKLCGLRKSQTPLPVVSQNLPGPLCPPASSLKRSTGRKAWLSPGRPVQGIYKSDKIFSGKEFSKIQTFPIRHPSNSWKAERISLSSPFERQKFQRFSQRRTGGKPYAKRI